MWYTYRINFVSGHYYFGYHKGSGLDDGYFGSPVTHKERWMTTMYSKTILRVFNTKEEAWKAEVELIRPQLADPLCLNENCGGYLSSEACKRGHATQKKLGVGIYAPGGQKRSFETCSKAGKAAKGFVFWNNGEINTKALECPGDGWVRGRLTKWHWYNNGSENKRAETCPEGFVPGRLMRRATDGTFTSQTK